jgi:signal transduction histidine kinase
MSRTLSGPTTYRSWVHAIVGGALWPLPAVIGFVVSVTAPRPARFDVFVAATIVFVAVSGLLRVSRTTAIRLGNALLGAEVPAATAVGGWPTRLRSAGWTLLHAGAGVALLIFAFFALITAMTLPMSWLGGGGDITFYGVALTIGAGWSGSWALLVAVGLVVLVVAAGAGYAVLLRRVAPYLLGPSAAERMAAVEQHADELAHRNRLARELHDSIGHTLTASTIQAAVASSFVDSDPNRARHAMNSIEEASRTALEDLDHVLGVLRDGGSAREPQYTLADLPTLLGRVRQTGTAVDAVVAGEPNRVPAAVSSEAYRIVQEGLTNAMRQPGPITVRIDVGPDRVDIALTNPITTDPPAAGGRGGRGLAGIAERVRVLRGGVTAGPVTDDTGLHWQLVAWLPLRPTP